MPTWDVVIIGAGTAGCVLANRLSEELDRRVLVLEAGPPDYWFDVNIHMPAALAFTFNNPLYDWRFESAPEPGAANRTIRYPRGRRFGGSSSINGMVFQRGNPLDFQRWSAAAGTSHWDYAHCLPYFRRMETCLAGADEWRGGDGPLKLERGAAQNPLSQAFLKAVIEAGYEGVPDLNGFRQEGFAPFDRTIYRGRRMSAARAYLHPVLHRKNLTVKSMALATKVLLRSGRVVGVEYLRAGRRHRVTADQVVLTGGVINSPQVLQLSGIGPRATLRAAGIEPVHELPAVGENLLEHIGVYVQHASKLPVSVAPSARLRNMPGVFLRWLFLRDGPGATNHFECGGFARSNDAVGYPNLMFHFLPITFDSAGNVAKSHGYQLHVGPKFGESTGSVRVRTADPRQHPRIELGLLKSQRDQAEAVEAVKVARGILSQPTFDRFDDGEISPGPAVTTDEEILEWFRRNVSPGFHGVSSNRMGNREDSVVDPVSFEVHGLRGLRVADASVMPVLPNANSLAPVVMLAERASDAIAGEPPLPADHRPFYRLRPDVPIDDPRAWDREAAPTP